MDQYTERTDQWTTRLTRTMKQVTQVYHPPTLPALLLYLGGQPESNPASGSLPTLKVGCVLLGIYILA